MHIYFIRHFKTQGNHEKRYIGRTDEPIVSPNTQILPSNLPQHPDAIFTSPMQRCLDTKTLCYAHSAHIIVNDLREMDFGAFENLTYEQLKNNPHYRNFIDGIEDAQDGEPTATFKTRCVNAFLHIIQQMQAKTSKSNAIASKNNTSTTEKTIVIVCHGGTIMAILEALDAVNGTFYDYQIANGAMLHCHWNGTHLTREEPTS